MNIRRKHIREVAAELLEEFCVITAPVNVDAIAVGRGILINRQPTEDDVSGYLLRDFQTGATVIGVNGSHHPNRQRFTVAHELGHFLLHKTQGLHVDRLFQVKHRNQRSSEGTDLDEMEANLFAAELLMPKEFVSRDWRECEAFFLDAEDQIAQLAKKYGVSAQAMAIRLSSLGLVSV